MFTFALDRWFAGITVRGLWRKNPKAILARIQSFEATEDDSAWQLLYAAAALPEPRAKAQLFLQSLEETHHAEIFRALYKQSAGRPMDKILVERTPLLRKDQPWKLFVYFTIGEKAAARRFRAIADQLVDGPFRRSLEKILDEEEGHVEQAGEMAALTGQSENAIRLEAKLVQLRRAGESWLRLGRKMSSLISRAILSGAYYTLGYLLRERRPS